MTSDVHTPSRDDLPATEPPTKKRKRSSDSDSEEVDPSIAFVYLSRDDLLHLSSKDLQNRVEWLEKQRALSPTELKEVKRQRRLIKNREYAQTSRMKKRNAITSAQV